jgi:hypothetical protein
MAIELQDMEIPPDSASASPAPGSNRSALVLLVCVIVTIAMIGLLLDSVTESFKRPKAPTASPTAVRLPGARDSFDRPDNARSLTKTASGQPWRMAAGRWGIADHEAFVVEPASGPSLATLPGGVPDGRVEATIARMAPGAGIAFRCRNPLNCWRVEAVPELGTWNVVKSVNGKEKRVANLGTVPVADGTRIAVDMRANRLSFFVNGRQATVIDDDALALETKAGLSLREPSSAATARWSSFVISPRALAGVLEAEGATVYDNFARRDGSSLRAARTAQAWTDVAGRWSIADGLAAPSAPSTTDRSMTLVDLGAADGMVQASLLAPQQRSGIAFRCRDARNCWLLEAVVGYGTWNVYKVVDGKVSEQGNLGIVPTDPGTTVTVEMRGPQLTFFVNGVRQRKMHDDTFATEHQAGLVVEAGPFSADTRWSEFIATTGSQP